MEMAVLDEVLGRSVAPQRFNLIVLGVFAAIGLALACAGIYSVIALSVSQRTREFGIRMALGADWRDVGGLVVRQGIRAALIGVAVGTAGALGLTRIIASQLYGVSPTDPPTFVAVSLLMIGIAAWTRSWRSGTSDPAPASGVRSARAAAEVSWADARRLGRER
jgi:ABC-type antimicrobial peptide transport system permease subunit